MDRVFLTKPTIFKSSIGGLEEQSMLRVHGRGLNGRYSEEGGIETSNVLLQEIGTSDRRLQQRSISLFRHQKKKTPYLLGPIIVPVVKGIKIDSILRP